MCGNVAEFCQDWYGAYECSATGTVENPIGPQKGNWRVVRGGSMIHEAADFRSARRLRRDAGYVMDYLGFRVVASFDAPPPGPPVAESTAAQPVVSVVSPARAGSNTAAAVKSVQPANNGPK